MYIHQHPNWTDFRWDADMVNPIIEKSLKAIGHLYGRLLSLGFDDQLKTVSENLSIDILKSSEIEGVKLNADDVRSSVARRLGLDTAISSTHSHYVEGIVEVAVDAMNHYDQPLTKELLCRYQSVFFPTGYSAGNKIEVGQYRTNPEIIVSGAFGREKVHYIAPEPKRIDIEMQRFIDWYNADIAQPAVVKSAIAHLWFVSIHPFEDGNGRLARIISDMMLARGDGSRLRFYNISAQINADKRRYYELLENIQRGDGDITEWIQWYLSAINEAVLSANARLSIVLSKSVFWRNAREADLSKRQVKMLNVFLDGYEAKINTKNWAALARCSRDTAQRDIADLVEKKLLRVNDASAKRPTYSICYTRLPLSEITDLSDTVQFYKKADDTYLRGEINGIKVEEKITKLDAEQLSAGQVSKTTLFEKYCCQYL